MSDDAGAVLQAYVRAGDHADDAVLGRCLASDVVTHSPGGTTTEGVAAVRDSWAAAHRGLSRLRHEVQCVLVAGDVAAARVVVTGVHTGPFLGLPASGAPVQVDLALFVRVVRGRIAEMWEVVDTGAALHQLGVLGDQPLSPG